jgi:hypothetical protein
VIELQEKYSTEGKLITAINESDLFRGITSASIPYWEGSSTELFERLRDVIPSRLIDNVGDLGKSLTKLHERKHPQVTKKKVDGIVKYRIRNSEFLTRSQNSKKA